LKTSASSQYGRLAVRELMPNKVQNIVELTPTDRVDITRAG